MLSLAGVRFRNVLAREGGPVEQVEVDEFPVYGRRMFQANARLRPGLAPRRLRYEIYGNVDGTGTAPSPLVASHMAISEAMERWAHRATVNTPDAADYGFDVDRSSTGMAAFPGLLARQARTKAWYEAVERFSMMAWWEGRLGGTWRDTEWNDVMAVQIDPIAAPACAVVVCKACEPGFYAYGHAAAGSFHAACERAIVELARSEYVLRRYWLARRLVDGTTMTQPAGLFERRCFFFRRRPGMRGFSRGCARERPTRPGVPSPRWCSTVKSRDRGRNMPACGGWCCGRCPPNFSRTGRITSSGEGVPSRYDPRVGPGFSDADPSRRPGTAVRTARRHGAPPP
jgi:hypothetical protein